MDNSQPTEENAIKKPLDPGHLTRTQLYIVAAILSFCVIGLSGYLIWDTYSQEFEFKQQAETSDSSEESDTSREETNTITFQYTHDGDRYTLNLENPENLEFQTVQRETTGKTLIVELGSDVALEIYQNDSISETSKGGAYGDIISNVTDEISRTGYNGHQYVLVVGEDRCDVPNQDPCVIVAFHNDSEGALSAFIRYPVSTGPEMLAYSQQAAIADTLIRSYSIESGWEENGESSQVTKTLSFHLYSWPDSFSFSIEVPEDTSLEQPSPVAPAPYASEATLSLGAGHSLFFQAVPEAYPFSLTSHELVFTHNQFGPIYLVKTNGNSNTYAYSNDITLSGTCGLTPTANPTPLNAPCGYTCINEAATEDLGFILVAECTTSDSTTACTESMETISVTKD